MPFRLNAKNVFLTYPRCSILPRTLGEHLESLRATTFVEVVRETHQDGTFHLHVLLQWADKYNLRNERFFDIQNHHPNIQAVRNVQDVHEYVRKALPIPHTESDLWESGTISVNPKADKWLKVANAATEEECIQAALEASPRDFVLQNDRIIEYARKKSRRMEEYRPDPNTRFRLPPEIIAYIANEFVNPVGLCPWLYNENHVIKVDQDESIVLKRCCFPGQPELAKRLGHVRLEHTFTGGACLTYRHTPPKRNTLSWMTSRSPSCRTRNNGGEHN